MSPTGWLDIHGHFNVPVTPEEAQKTVEGFRKLQFLIDKPWTWGRSYHPRVREPRWHSDANALICSAGSQ
jgi:hypothetical protein